MFKSSDCVAIHLQDITAAENFYTNVMKFTLVNRSESHLEYDTGLFRLCVDRELNARPPLPNFTVPDIGKVKTGLVANGCVILRESHNCLNFSDPFGITYAIVQA
ncbi:VOC family protein [Tunturiibacter gelidoferens]|uniref:Catechol 2,3-dioxygenase-like lactoylglutathione lyase family enzyme n=2 Tax=Tunturiibacter TaxID=3154218 RepID=A0A7Y9NIV0_9BACT|nr:bleomycin resistance protein [Edaphobacter lichenicola]NYF50185.1 catechol 2,3-dioxygenase-like lactoylglutathione lyase family enzyme [Edaphobacter lichenicola]